MSEATPLSLPLLTWQGIKEDIPRQWRDEAPV